MTTTGSYCEQLLITIDGIPRLTEMKSMKSLKRGRSVIEAGTNGQRQRRNTVLSTARAVKIRQEAQLSLRDCASMLSVEIW